MDCRELRPIIDSYISDELLVETNHDVLRHLENCSDCRHEMSERRSLKMRIRHTVKHDADAQIDPVFAARTATSLREMALRPSAWDRYFAGGSFFNLRGVTVCFACVLVLVLGGMIWLNRSDTAGITAGTQIQQTNRDNSTLANAVRASWSEMTSQAVGDHENCAVEFHLKETPISLDEAATKFGTYNKDLDKVIMAAFQSDANVRETEFIEAHSCIFEGRRFAHIVVRHKGRMVSLLVTDTDLPAGNESVQTAQFDGATNAAGFHAGHQAVFVVSQLAAEDNVTLVKAAAPAIRLHVEKLGA